MPEKQPRRPQIHRAEWFRLPPSRKHWIGKVPHLLTLDPDTGGTVLQPVELVGWERAE